MSNDTENKGGGLSAKYRLQIELQQTDESLRLVKNEISNLSIQIRKYQQDYSRAKITLEAAEARLKVLKVEEFNLNQNAMRQKRALVAQK